MTVRTSVLWKILTHMAKKWPGMVVQRSFIKEDSFVYRLYFLLVCWFFPILYPPFENSTTRIAIPIGLDLRTSVPARTALPNLDQSIQFDTLSAPEVPEPFTTIAPPRQNKQRIPKQRRKKIPKQRIPKQRIPKQRIPKQRNDLANDATPGKEFCNPFA